MVKEDQVQPPKGFGRIVPRAPRAARVGLRALILIGVGLLAASGFFLLPKPQPAEPGEAGQPPENASTLFADWPKPDVVLVLSGQQHGYLQPCGCSEPQKGGLARRYNFVKSLKQRGWPVVLADLGDIAQKNAPQTLLKYVYSMKALRELGYTAVSFGENEMALGLLGTLGQYATNEKEPAIIAANLNAKFPGKQLDPKMVGDYKLTSPKGGEPKVGFVGVIAPSVAKPSQEDDVSFDPVDKVLPSCLKAAEEQGAECFVALLQGTEEEAKNVAKKYPQIHVVLYTSDAEEPSSRPGVVGNTLLISVGHKGRYVGVVGVNKPARAGSPFELRYQLVSLDPVYETPEGQDAQNPIHALMQQYAEEVRDKNFLAQYRQGPHPIQIAFPASTYVGSEKCKKCHESAYEIWSKHRHAHAYDTLVEKAKRPTLRQFDGECVVCHVTGFGYKTGFTSAPATPKLENVGCESCHGPCSLHVRDKNDLKIRALINPDKIRPGEDKNHHTNRMNDSCMKCHDQDNSVNFHFEEYWTKKQTEHYTKED
jgi:hypothetical protein